MSNGTITIKPITICHGGSIIYCRNNHSQPCEMSEPAMAHIYDTTPSAFRI